MAHEMAQALGSLSLAAEVSGVEPPPPQRVSSGAAWRAEMKMRTVVRVSAATEVGAPYSALKFSVHARPGDTEPFTVERSMNQLTKFIAAAGKAFGERAALPPLPRVPPPPADKLDEPYLTVAVALVQAWIDECLAAIATPPERIVFARALENDPDVQRVRKITQGAFARNAAAAMVVANVALNATQAKVSSLFKTQKDAADGFILSEENMDLIIDHLTAMRGAALKIAQQIVTSDGAGGASSNFDPRFLKKLKDRVLNQSYSLPAEDVSKVLCSELGPDWKRLLGVFHARPFASASIGQVHTGTNASGETPIVLKIQFPGIDEAIGSDLDSINSLLALVMRNHAAPDKDIMDHHCNWHRIIFEEECDYRNEAANLRAYVAAFDSDPHAEQLKQEYDVPVVVDELSTRRVLTMGMVTGTVAAQLDGSHVPQAVRNEVARRIVQIKLREIFSWRFVNLDPHLGNFVWNSTSQTLGLLDFGCCRKLEPLTVDLMAAFVSTNWLHHPVDRARHQTLHKRIFGNVYEESTEMKEFLELEPLWHEAMAACLQSDAPFDFERWMLTAEIDYKPHGARLKAGRYARGGTAMSNAQERAEALGLDDVPTDEWRFAHSTLMLKLIETLRATLLHCATLKATISLRPLFVEALAPWEGAALPMPPCVVWRDPEQAGGGLR